MDPFAEDRPELTGGHITMEFGNGGRIEELWATDPMLPDEGEEFQFVILPVGYGEENAADLYPGTVLLGARTDPSGPWIVSRNGQARHVFDFESEGDFERSSVAFEYEFPLLPEVQASGRYFVSGGPIPQIVWEVELGNRGQRAIEIGELGFPLALNTFYDGFGWSDDQLRRLWTSRLYVHKFIGGAASWIFAQRMTAEPPGLLIFPGENTGWEFFAHVPSSLNTPFQWEGIPVVYVHSRATVEREGWKHWANGHTSLILEPGEGRAFQTRFVATARDKQDDVSQTLAACGRPAIRLLPGAVAPAEVGIAVEVLGAVPKRFWVSREAEVEIETDTDEEGGFCFVRPREPGPVRVSFEDRQGRLSHCHLMFTEPVETLIRKRAAYIAARQFHEGSEAPLREGILLANTETGERVSDPEEYAGASGIECSLADALFLAEKNAHYPSRAEIAILDRYIAGFLQEGVQNPGDMSVGSVLAQGPAAGGYAGRPMTYPAVFNLYHAMYRVATVYGETRHRPLTYLGWAAQTAIAMFRFGWRHYVRTVGLLGYGRIYELLRDLESEGLAAEHARLSELAAEKARALTKQRYPYAGESVLDTSGFEEVYCAALQLNDDEHLERTMRCAYAARSLAPSWWWYGSDKRSWDGDDSTPLRALMDRGEACLAQTTIPNSLIFFESLDRDYLAIPEAYMRLAFGGMMGPWALVRSDGAASMCYCPDLSSRHHGYNAYTGSGGLGYFHYLRGAGAYVLPNRNMETFTFGCHFEQDADRLIVRPWDGVGRRAVLRQYGAEFEITFGRFREIVLGARKRWFEAEIENPCDKDARALLRARGLWGSQVQIAGKVHDAVDGEVTVEVVLPAKRTTKVTGKVAR